MLQQIITKLLTPISILGLMIFVTNQELHSQDVRFTQYYASPQRLNPAMVGVFDGSFRATANYRNQWASVLGDVPYASYSVGVEGRLYSYGEDYVGLGLSFLGDEAGSSQFSQTEAHLGASYMKKLGGKRRSYRQSQYLTIGAQLGVGQRGINWDALQWSSQFTGENYNPNLPSGENLGGQSDMFMDINAGLMWYAVYDKNLNLYAGLSFAHLTTPDISFYGDIKEPLYTRYTLHGGGSIPMSKKLSLHPNGMILMQGPSLETNLGSYMRYSNKDWYEISLKAGVYSRIVKNQQGIANDAVQVMIGADIQTWSIGFSYDINTSLLRAASNGQGAFEISLAYINPANKRNRLVCPKF